MAGKREKGRATLTKERVFETAVDLADEDGVEALTMRKLARELGVEAMSLYHHVADKEAILDGMVECVFREIELSEGLEWKSAMRARAGGLRDVLVKHRWAVSLLDSRRNPGEATLKHQDWVLGCLYDAGFSVALAASAAATLDSYIYGFAMQEVSLPFNTPEEVEEVVTAMLEHLPAEIYPNLTRMARDHVMKPGYSFAKEFSFGLELTLDGLDRARTADRRR